MTTLLENGATPPALLLASLWWLLLAAGLLRLRRAWSMRARRPALLIAAALCGLLATACLFALLAQLLTPFTVALLALLIGVLGVVSLDTLRQLHAGLLLELEGQWQRGDRVQIMTHEGTIEAITLRHITLVADDGARSLISHLDWSRHTPTLRHRGGMPWIEHMSFELPAAPDAALLQQLRWLALSSPFVSTAAPLSIDLQPLTQHRLRVHLQLPTSAPQQAPQLRADLSRRLLLTFPDATL